MEKVLVTGANGHLGFHIVSELVKRGYDVRASLRDINNPRKTNKLKDLGVEIVYADLLDRASLVKAMQGCDGLFQVAAGFKVHSNDMMQDVWRPAMDGTENALRAAHESGIKKVIYTSSVAAVGVTDDGVARDEQIWNDQAQEFYARAKNEAEKLAWKLKHELSLNLVQPASSGRYIVTRETVPALKVYTIAHAAYHRVKVPARRIPKFMLPLLPLMDWMENRFTGSMRTMTRGVVREYMTGKQQLFDTAKATRELAWAPRPIEDSIRDTLHWIYEQ